MDKQSFRDRGLLIPIGISVFSILGILIALLIVYFDKPAVVASPGPTATPFKFLLIATETSVLDLDTETPLPEVMFTEEPTEPILINTPEAGFPTPSIDTTPVPPILASVTPPISNATSDATSSATSSITPTIATPASNAADRLDDRDPLLDYGVGSSWVSETNAGAYQQTLTVSNEIGNDVIFDFVGQQVIIGYLGASGLGQITIYIDDNEFLLDQSVGRQWVSPQFANEEHFVFLIHEDGDS
ncbi:MAG: hypothetical protein ACXW4U_14345, partial [Anaerolineales bacterium]